MTAEQISKAQALGLEPAIVKAVAREAALVTQAWMYGRGEEIPSAWPIGRGMMINCTLHVLASPDIPLNHLHQYWLQQMIGRGWSFGHFVDLEEYEHPFIQPWHLLSADQRQHHLLFKQAVATALEYYGTETEN